MLSLLVVLFATAGSIGLGVLLKQPCTGGDWQDGRQYRLLCYTDIVPLYGTEKLSGNRLPYLDDCMPHGGATCDEYPVLTMYFMRIAAWVSRGYGGFFYANAFLLGVCALITSFLLYRTIGERALYFALAPTLMVLGLVNWDLLAVALAAGGTLAYLRGRDQGSGILLGLGAAAKLYPALLVIPFAAGRLRARRTAEAGRLVVWSAVTFAAVNLPFALLGTRGWWTFFKNNEHRQADFDSIWFVACDWLHGAGGGACGWSPRLLNVASLSLLVAVVAVVWGWRAVRAPDFPRWTLGFPVIALFLLTNKVYSPQYSLWLLPWFALALPNLWLFAAFEVADVAVFVTRFSWFGRLSAQIGLPGFAGYHGAPLWLFQTALVARALVLLGCVVAWARLRGSDGSNGEPTSPVGRHGRTLGAPAPALGTAGPHPPGPGGGPGSGATDPDWSNPTPSTGPPR
jgi:uncharacterized membrane protein